MKHGAIDFDTLRAHLERTGRLKLLPQIAREMRREQRRELLRAPRKETATENPSLISGWRSIEDGKLIDRSGKGALIEMYRNIIR